MNMYNPNVWEELDDHHNMINEFAEEPDYYVDKAPDATYIANEEGFVKATQIFDGEYELFDYENEVEPIL